MQKFMTKVNEAKVEYYKQKEYLENRIELRQQQIERLQKRRDKLVCPHYHDALKEISKYICERTGYDYEILGPFGLRAQSSLWIVDKTKSRKDLSAYIIWSLSVSPHYEDNGHTQYLTYDTGKKQGNYHPNSLGALNGFDNVEDILPDTIEEVWELMKSLKEKEI